MGEEKVSSVLGLRAFFAPLPFAGSLHYALRIRVGPLSRFRERDRVRVKEAKESAVAAVSLTLARTLATSPGIGRGEEHALRHLRKDLGCGRGRKQSQSQWRSRGHWTLYVRTTP